MIPQASKSSEFTRLYRGDRLLIVHFAFEGQDIHLIIEAEML